jgi:uncharacterized protein YndB with AHSA1/START domain
MTDETNKAHELSVTRLIDASPETVYRVYTERTNEWFAPKPYQAEVDWDLRPGGKANLTMSGPDGFHTSELGVFLEVVPGRKIVATDAFAPGWLPQDPFLLTIATFEPEGSGTRYTATARHWSEEKLKSHEEMGFHDGWSTVAAQLAEIAEAEERAAA